MKTPRSSSQTHAPGLGVYQVAVDGGQTRIPCLSGYHLRPTLDPLKCRVTARQSTDTEGKRPRHICPHPSQWCRILRLPTHLERVHTRAIRFHVTPASPCIVRWSLEPLIYHMPPPHPRRGTPTSVSSHRVPCGWRADPRRARLGIQTETNQTTRPHPHTHPTRPRRQDMQAPTLSDSGEPRLISHVRPVTHEKTVGRRWAPGPWRVRTSPAILPARHGASRGHLTSGNDPRAKTRFCHPHDMVPPFHRHVHVYVRPQLVPNSH